MAYHLCEYVLHHVGFVYQSFVLGVEAMELSAHTTSPASCQKVEVHYNLMEILQHLVFLYLILWNGFNCSFQCD